MEDRNLPVIRRFFFLFSWEARDEKKVNVSGVPFSPFARLPNFVPPTPTEKKKERLIAG